MIEIDDRHKQILQWAVQAYYYDYLEMRKERLEELKALDESISELRSILTSLGYPSETALSVQPSQPVSMQRGDDPKQDVEQIPTEVPKKSEQEQNHAGSPADNVLRPQDLKLPAFEYDKANMNSYKMIFFHELPDGRVVIKYGNAHYYTAKEAVMKIPYPFPVKYFGKENGWSSTVEQAFKNYRKYLAEQESIEAQVETQAQEVQTATPQYKLVYAVAHTKTTLKGLGRQYRAEVQADATVAHWDISGGVRSGREHTKGVLAIVNEEHPLFIEKTGDIQGEECYK